MLRDLLAGRRQADDVVETLTDSGLRGMGGAGFPTGKKWSLVADQAATPAYVVCNADESEPGTFKDRQILADQPHLVLEGLLLGMVVVGAEEGWVFVRHEYGPETDVLRAELDRLRDEGLLGRRRARHRAAARRSRCSCRPAATSSARRRRCSSAWRATAASRGTSRRSPACTACGASRR